MSYEGRRPRILPAHAMKKMPNIYLQEQVNNLLRLIESQVKAAVESKVMTISTELGTMFDIPGMNLERARKTIYYNVIHELELAGYTVTIQFTKNGKVFLHVRWFDDSDVEADNYMSTYIKEHAIIKSAIRPAQQPHMAPTTAARSRPSSPSYNKGY